MVFRQKYSPPKLYPEPGAKALGVQEQGPNEQSIVASGMTVEEWKRKHPTKVMGPEPEEVGQVTTDPPDGSPPETPFPSTGRSPDPFGEITEAFEKYPVPITSHYPTNAIAAEEEAEKAALKATESQAIADAAAEAAGGGEPGPEPEPGELAITAPTEGSTVPTVHSVTGTGATPDTEVTLTHVEIAEQVATTTADASGNWGFTGNTPAAPGEMTWEVANEGNTAQVHITVEEPVTQGVTEEEKLGPWHDMATHAALDQYLADNEISQPPGWGSMNLAQKREWMDANIELDDEPPAEEAP